MGMKSGWNFPRPANGSGQPGYARGGAVKMPHPKAAPPARVAAPRLAPAPVMRPMAPPMAAPMAAAPLGAPPPGMAKGGQVVHHHHHIVHGKSDAIQDREMITKAVHEHEQHDHKGEPLTNLHFAHGGHVTAGGPVAGNTPHIDHTGAMSDGMTHVHHHHIHEIPADGRGGHEPSAGYGDGYAEGGNFIAGAIKKPGQLHRDLHVPQGKKIPASKLEAAAHRPGKVGQRARFAETLKGLSHHKKK